MDPRFDEEEYRREIAQRVRGRGVLRWLCLAWVVVIVCLALAICRWL